MRNTLVALHYGIREEYYALSAAETTEQRKQLDFLEKREQADDWE